MNVALAILSHALRMLAYEPGVTLRVVLPAALVVILSAVGAGNLASDALLAVAAPPQEAVMPEPGQVLILLLCGLGGLLGYALMAMLWHRHVLLNGPSRADGLRPAPSVLLGYIWRAIVVGVVQLIVAIPIGIGLIIIVSMGGDAPGELLVAAASFVAGIVFLWAALRISVVLPAAALGHLMTIKQSWAATEQIAGPIWGVALMLAAFNMALSALATALLPSDPSLRLICDSVLYIVEGLIFISVLTTLYGSKVQGRALG